MSDIDELNKLLWDAEEIGIYVNSSCGEDDGILVVTNRRIFFALKGDLSIKVTNNIYVDKIRGVNCGKDTYSGWIEIGIKRKRKCLRFHNVDNSSVIEVSDYIKGMVGKWREYSDYQSPNRWIYQQ